MMQAYNSRSGKTAEGDRGFKKMCRVSSGRREAITMMRRHAAASDEYRMVIADVSNLEFKNHRVVERMKNGIRLKTPNCVVAGRRSCSRVHMTMRRHR